MEENIQTEDIQTLEDVINVIENLINKYKEQEKIIELMAENIYNTSDTLNMLNIGKEINYDLEKIFNGIEDKEAIKIIIEYFKKKAKGE